MLLEKNPNLILDEYPDYNLIALVPGQHAKWSHVYRSDVMVDSQRKSYSSTDGSTKSVDVWEIEEENVDELTQEDLARLRIKGSGAQTQCALFFLESKVSNKPVPAQAARVLQSIVQPNIKMCLEKLKTERQIN